MPSNSLILEIAWVRSPAACKWHFAEPGELIARQQISRGPHALPLAGGQLLIYPSQYFRKTVGVFWLFKGRR